MGLPVGKQVSSKQQVQASPIDLADKASGQTVDKQLECSVALTRGRHGYGLRLDWTDADQERLQVTAVIEDGPAEQSQQIAVGDILLEVDGIRVGKGESLASLEQVKEKMCQMLGKLSLKVSRSENAHPPPKALAAPAPNIKHDKPKVEHPKLREYRDKLQKALTTANTPREQEVDFKYELDMKNEKRKLAAVEKANTDSSIPDPIVPLMARLVQGSRLSKSKLAAEVHEILVGSGIACAQNISLEAVTAKLALIADRKVYGVKDKDFDIWEDTRELAICRWEVEILDYFNDSAPVKDLRIERRNVSCAVIKWIQLIAVGRWGIW